MLAAIDPVLWDFWRSVGIAVGAVLMAFVLLVTAIYWTRRKSQTMHNHVYLIAASYALAIGTLVADQTTRFGTGLTWRLPVIFIIELLGIFALRNLWKRHQLSREFRKPEESDEQD